MKKVRKLKPFMTETQIAVGVNKAKGFLFLPSEELIREIKKELAPWEAAAIEDSKDW